MFGYIFTLQTGPWVTGTNKVQQLVAVFADEWFQMVTRNVVPFDSVVVEIV